MLENIIVNFVGNLQIFKFAANTRRRHVTCANRTPEIQRKSGNISLRKLSDIKKPGSIDFTGVFSQISIPTKVQSATLISRKKTCQYATNRLTNV